MSAAGYTNFSTGGEVVLHPPWGCLQLCLWLARRLTEVNQKSILLGAIHVVKERGLDPDKYYLLTILTIYHGVICLVGLTLDSHAMPAIEIPSRHVTVMMPMMRMSLVWSTMKAPLF